MTVQPMLTSLQLEKAGIVNPAEKLAYFKCYPIVSASERAKAKREMARIKTYFIADCVKHHIPVTSAWAEIEVESDALAKVMKALIDGKIVSGNGKNAVIETA